MSAPATTLWLIRHGQPDKNSRGRCYGKLDVNLSSQGRHQMTAVAKSLASEPLAAVYSSPRRRALESAQVLVMNRGIQIGVLPEFCEIDFGDFEGRTYDEIAREFPEMYRAWMDHPTEVQFPNGETFSDMWRRVTRAALDLRNRHPGESLAAVTHGGVIRILLAEALDLAWPNIFRIGQDFAAVSRIRYFGQYTSVDLVNSGVSVPARKVTR